jgi:aminopeptidase N
MRVEDIRDLREYQFPEDAGPTAHPVQPTSYIEMNNFYTATVYEKGSEVIRMMATLLGPVGFRSAMDLYFDTFDGQAVTTQDYVWAMATAANIDLTQFEETWYHQERTPGLRVTGAYDDQKKTYTMECEQIIEKNTRGEVQKPFFYPFRITLFTTDGAEFPLVLENPV